ncbi:cardiolipin synthetase [Escherichia coli]|uniref:Cardiolipin synthetase n=1 Tax=Escherichia coli TaxID=562 RepID=A0A377E689_ECOLX|nr:cardiolipin synthetase [Escherichia coli]
MRNAGIEVVEALKVNLMRVFFTPYGPAPTSQDDHDR